MAYNIILSQQEKQFQSYHDEVFNFNFGETFLIRKGMLFHGCEETRRDGGRDGFE